MLLRAAGNQRSADGRYTGPFARDRSRETVHARPLTRDRGARPEVGCAEVVSAALSLAALLRPGGRREQNRASPRDPTLGRRVSWDPWARLVLQAPESSPWPVPDPSLEAGVSLCPTSAFVGHKEA